MLFIITIKELAETGLPTKKPPALVITTPKAGIPHSKAVQASQP
jgi:hypothetical protein